MGENKFFVCEHCGNVVELVHDSGVPIMCCGQKMTRVEPGTEVTWEVEAGGKKVCKLKPVDTSTKENYVVCNCNNVSYFDILDEVHKHSNLDNLLGMFEEVKNTTHCSTGCGGCYDKVIEIISETMMNGEKG